MYRYVLRGLAVVVLLAVIVSGLSAQYVFQPGEHFFYGQGSNITVSGSFTQAVLAQRRYYQTTTSASSYIEWVQSNDTCSMSFVGHSGLTWTIAINGSTVATVAAGSVPSPGAYGYAIDTSSYTSDFTVRITVASSGSIMDGFRAYSCSTYPDVGTPPNVTFVPTATEKPNPTLPASVTPVPTLRSVTPQPTSTPYSPVPTATKINTSTPAPTWTGVYASSTPAPTWTGVYATSTPVPTLRSATPPPTWTGVYASSTPAPTWTGVYVMATWTGVYASVTAVPTLMSVTPQPTSTPSTPVTIIEVTTVPTSTPLLGVALLIGGLAAAAGFPYQALAYVVIVVGSGLNAEDFTYVTCAFVVVLYISSAIRATFHTGSSN